MGLGTGPWRLTDGSLHGITVSAPWRWELPLDSLYLCVSPWGLGGTGFSLQPGQRGAS